MSGTNRLKLFISYSHNDENYITEFIKHISTFENQGLINYWYDKRIIPGDQFQYEIDINIENADIICLFVSSNFLSSYACRAEKDRALELENTKGTSVVPIIISSCGWKDEQEFPKKIALPSDGRPVETYDNVADGWHDVYSGLKKVIDKELLLREVVFCDVYASFLKSTEMLTKAHSQKNEVHLDDIFVFPELEKFDELREYDKQESSENIFNELIANSKIVIAGENQSGKTTICKKIILELKERNYFPIYLSNNTTGYVGKIVNKISSAFAQQYNNIDFDNIPRARVVPIVDDFHFAKNKEKHILDLAQFKYQVIVVDDIFCLNLKNEDLVESYKHFRIKELRPSLRDELIRKWTYIGDSNTTIRSDNENGAYKKIDATTELVNISLGKAIGSGLMPAYPFFILSVISTNETFGKTLDSEITSQGHCYQALIYLYLKKEGVKNDDIDTYINFLIECAYFFYIEKMDELPESDFNRFIDQYKKKFNLPIKLETLLSTLNKTQMISVNSFGNHRFCYPYLYYFFVAKYLSEHLKDTNDIIDSILENLHTDENAYIAVFLSHHSKESDILDGILINAFGLFENYEPASLNKNELSFFDENVESIIQEVLPSSSSTAERERARILEEQDGIEDCQDEKKSVSMQDEAFEDHDFSIELRRSIKTVEVMGRIIKSRSGSLDKERLESIFQEGMRVHLRILSSFFDLIKNDEDEIVDYLSSMVKTFLDAKAKKREQSHQTVYAPRDEDVKKLANQIFWNINYGCVYALLNKIIHSLGSNNLTDVVVKVCDEENTPASFLVKHGILMWYNKNLQIGNILDTIVSEKYSETSKRMMKKMIVSHCSLHSIDYKQKQLISNQLGIPPQRLIKQQ